MARKRAQGKGNKQPLYATVYDELVERIRSATWAPGQLIPSEFAIAAESRVSQGTVRKALGRLADEKLVVRVQGRGTFVTEHTPEHFLFRFFNVFDEKGTRVIPSSRSARGMVGRASRIERKALKLRKNARVIRFRRLRKRGRRPIAAEFICLPVHTFKRLARRPGMPDTLYDVFQRDYGVLIMRTEERITAVGANAEAASRLNVAPGTPLLRIERIAIAQNGRPVERRVSFYHLHRAHYQVATE